MTSCRFVLDLVVSSTVGNFGRSLQAKPYSISRTQETVEEDMSLTIEPGRDPILDMDPWRGAIHAHVEFPASGGLHLNFHLCHCMPCDPVGTCFPWDGFAKMSAGVMHLPRKPVVLTRRCASLAFRVSASEAPCLPDPDLAGLVRLRHLDLQGSGQVDDGCKEK